MTGLIVFALLVGLAIWATADKVHKPPRHYEWSKEDVQRAIAAQHVWEAKERERERRHGH